MSANPNLRVTDAVRASGMSQVQLAQLLELSPPAVRDRLRGRTRWALTEVTTLAEALDLDLSDLLGVTSDGEEVSA